jgi:aldehyde:ferredoxin oxidoreductase
MAWHQKILRVNLSKGTCESEPLNMDWAEKYLGQRGLGTKYLSEEIDPKVDAMSPENKLIIATGPLTGTAAATGGRWSVITKGPLTGAIAASNSGGYFGAELKMAGWDMVIFEGRSDKPVYLFVQDGNPQLLPADDLWGQDVWETEEALLVRHQDTQIKVAAIGRAGETGCRYACVVNDKHRAAGRSGVGAVMGSKNLKAIAVRGTLGVTTNDPAAFMAATADAKKVLAEDAVTGQGLPAMGTQVIMNAMNELGGLPTRNHQEVQFEGANNIGAEAMMAPRPDGTTNLVKNQACFGCTIACGRIAKIQPDHFSIKDSGKEWGASGGLEYESAWAFGADTGVDDLDALTYVNFLCNMHGMDTISFGATVAAAMELFEAGAITTKETGGVDLKFGSAEALVAMAELLGRGEGFGLDIGLGSKRLCEKYGHPEMAMVVKGQEFPAYDPRAMQGMALGYATSNRGACHLRGYTVSAEVFGVPEKMEPSATEGKAAVCMAFQNATSVVDSAGICSFATFAWTLEDVQKQLHADLEGDWSLDRLLETGERVWNLERQFNLSAGLTIADDTLPARLLKDAAKTGPAKGQVAELGKMLPEYYELRGWTPEGVPTNATLDRLAL